MNSMGSRWLWLILIGSVAAVAGAYVCFPRSISDRRPEGSDRGAAGVSDRTVVCFGHVDVESGILMLRPTATGRIIEVAVTDNQAVSPGAVLLRVDDALARLQVEEARAEWKSAESQAAQLKKLPEQHDARLAAQRGAIDAAQSRLAAALQLLARKKNLRDSKLLSDEEVRAAEEQIKELTAASEVERQRLRDLELQAPAAQIALAEANVQARKARLDQAVHNLAECELKAPTAGQVLRVLAAAGDLAGGSSQQPTIQFCPEQPRIIRAEIPQGFVRQLAVGQPVLIQDDVRTEEVWHGKVARISDWYTQRRSILQEPQQRNDMRTVECIVELAPGQPHLRIGQRMLVSLNCDPRSQR
jgi:multidrug resistance efflux pump